MVARAQGFHTTWADVRHYDDGRKGETLASLSYTDTQGRTHTAPVAMPTDGGSQPAGWYAIDRPYGKYLRAYLIHDYYCARARHLLSHGLVDAARALRLDADRLLREMVLFLGAPRWKAAAIYRGVRTGAWWAGVA